MADTFEDIQYLISRGGTYNELRNDEKIRSIVSLKKLNSKILLKNIVKWIKTDFGDRQQYIKDLMELTNFDDIKDKDFERQIFTDDILMQNKEYVTMSIKYWLSRVCKFYNASENAVNIPKKTLFAVTSNNIFCADFDTKEFISTKLRPELTSFATSCHTTNGFITTGGWKNGGAVNLCKQFCPSTNEEKEFPGLLEARIYHRNYIVGSNIYTCGGYYKNTVEIYNENAGKWIRGPAMNNDRYFFGAADDSRNGLYAIGGRPLWSSNNSIDHLDNRTHSWHTIYRDPSVEVGFTQSVYKDDQIYCFGETKGFIFDIRANKNLATIPYKLDYVLCTMNFELFWNEFDCTIVDNDIWIIGRIKVNKVLELLDAFRFDLQTNTWERKTFKGLDESKSLGLVWCKNN